MNGGTILLNRDGKRVTVARTDYITAKTKQLREFGYSELEEKEVDEQLAAIISGKELNVIGLFMQDDIALA